ncbi:hypothetical protein ACTHPH_21940 [Paenibacillus pasadenensis]|uniref:hypothetical protein n=1 Tax=Paenibacillus pasadenensis TaxID=217090 RepID=UPI00048D2CAF|nr:hypothetical protein [Paenibacillus pasadenensis]
MIKSLVGKRVSTILVFVILQLIALALLRGGLDIMDGSKVWTALMWGAYLFQILGCLFAAYEFWPKRKGTAWT